MNTRIASRRERAKLPPLPAFTVLDRSNTCRIDMHSPDGQHVDSICTLADLRAIGPAISRFAASHGLMPSSVGYKITWPDGSLTMAGDAPVYR